MAGLNNGSDTLTANTLKSILLLYKELVAGFFSVWNVSFSVLFAFLPSDL